MDARVPFLSRLLAWRWDRDTINRTEALETTVAVHETENLQGTKSTRPDSEEVKNHNNVKEDDEFVKNMSGWLMTVATLLMSMAFQSGMSIPGGYWDDTKINSSSASNDSSNDTKHTAGQPIIMNMDHYRYFSFLILNVAAFGTSMLVIVLLLFNKFPQHTLLSIRWLLVYAMVIIAMVYALGCAPKIVFALYISAFMLNCMIVVLITWASWLLLEYFRKAASDLWKHMRSMRM